MFQKNICEVSTAVRGNSNEICIAARGNSYEANTVSKLSKKLTESWILTGLELT